MNTQRAVKQSVIAHPKQLIVKVFSIAMWLLL